MRRTLAFGLVALPLCFLLAARSNLASPNRSAEVARIQDHLGRVVHTMRSAASDHLTQEQQELRQAALTWLDDYRAAGVFPHNHVRRGERVPVFVDPHGTPCAVGYLMLRSGHPDLVEEIVRTDNLVQVSELRGHERVKAWLDAHGITLAEAALIQPMYDHFPAPPNAVPVSSSYRPVTVGLSVASAALASYTAMLGADRGTPWVDALAFATTMGHTYLILNAKDTRADEPSWAVGLNVGGIVASVGSEIIRMVRHQDARSATQKSPIVETYVVPGANGTEIGFAVRH